MYWQMARLGIGGDQARKKACGANGERTELKVTLNQIKIYALCSLRCVYHKRLALA